MIRFAATAECAASSSAAAESRAGGVARRRAVAALGRMDRMPLVSVTHHAGVAVAVAATGVRGIGVDLEPARRLAPSIARYYLTARERQGRTCSLLACWVLKEAAWKAFALGDGDAFTDLELLWTRGLPRAVRVRGTRRPIGAALFAPRPGWLCAVVALPEAAR